MNIYVATASQALKKIFFFLLAIACKPLLDPGQGFKHCSHPHGPNSFNSSCNFYCKLGFHLEGAPRLVCQASGHWNNPVPLCRGIATIVLSVVEKVADEKCWQTNEFIIQRLHIFITVCLSPEVPCFKRHPHQCRQYQLQPPWCTKQLQLHLWGQVCRGLRGRWTQPVTMWPQWPVVRQRPSMQKYKRLLWLYITVCISKVWAQMGKKKSERPRSKKKEEFSQRQERKVMRK